MPKGVYERNQIAQPATPAQPTEAPVSARAQETRRERRRRDDGDLDRMGRMALSIPPEVQERLTREGKVGRWVRDAAGRQSAMQANDWDVTPGVDPVPEARDSEGKLVLMEKFGDWYDDDQRAKSNLLDEREKAIERGQKTDPEDRRQPGTFYVPEGNRITREPGA
jgi:hypothetical protein